MTKSTITRERLEQLADNNTICKVSWDERIELAQIALAAMDSEPVAWTWHYREQWHVTNDSRRAEFVAKDGDVAVLPLYRHAQPAPVAPVCTCPSGDGSLRWPCPVHPGNSPAIPDAARDALEKALTAMEFMGDTLNNLDAVCSEDVEFVTPAFDAVRRVLAAAPQEVK
ncbi:hypothetical protein [Klebsiella pneumoniae]|uniref:Eaa1 n=1 Tax=Klebsiella pneumoniae TaxID=573 RepID=A0A483YGS9_KLEPN|nr:hypothetical protein [Klebsiella pneumoniae]MDX7557897.1 hypothetical protein [Klebsiella pneumoniae]MEB4558650.1 hypothetical protein [Klebsiella pneumoniae]HBZ3951149.1 hypothetical protein [Klebsiella pneumoniae]HBZ3980201.1 hypothetical protein [Klebsiella pneumoniae]HBZ4045677.1 hypothetical protein [Klebsiella pneumoniae]